MKTRSGRAYGQAKVETVISPKKFFNSTPSPSLPKSHLDFLRETQTEFIPPKPASPGTKSLQNLKTPPEQTMTETTNSEKLKTPTLDPNIPTQKHINPTTPTIVQTPPNISSSQLPKTKSSTNHEPQTSKKVIIPSSSSSSENSSENESMSEDEDEENPKSIFMEKFTTIKDFLLTSLKDHEKETAFTTDYRSETKRVKEDLNLFNLALTQTLPKQWEEVYQEIQDRRKNKRLATFLELKKELESDLKRVTDTDKDLLLKCVSAGKIEKKKLKSKAPVKKKQK